MEWPSLEARREQSSLSSACSIYNVTTDMLQAAQGTDLKLSYIKIVLNILYKPAMKRSTCLYFTTHCFNYSVLKILRKTTTTTTNKQNNTRRIKDDCYAAIIREHCSYISKNLYIAMRWFKLFLKANLVDSFHCRL